MAEAIPALFRGIRFSSCPSISRFLPFNVPPRTSTIKCVTSAGTSGTRIRCEAVGLEASPASESRSGRKKNRYEMENYSTWLLRQEQSGNGGDGGELDGWDPEQDDLLEDDII